MGCHQRRLSHRTLAYAGIVCTCLTRQVHEVVNHQPLVAFEGDQLSITSPQASSFECMSGIFAGSAWAGSPTQIQTKRCRFITEKVRTQAKELRVYWLGV